MYDFITGEEVISVYSIIGLRSMIVGTRSFSERPDYSFLYMYEIRKNNNRENLCFPRHDEG